MYSQQPLMYSSPFCFPPPMPPPTAVANPATAAMYLSKMLEEEDQLAAEALEQQEINIILHSC